MNTLDSISLRDLKATMVLSECLHFGRAAAICNITQPALTAIIKKVEQSLGVRIFRRNSRMCELSTEGVEVISQIRHALGILTKLRQKHRDIGPLEGRLHLGVIPTIGPYYLPTVIKPLFSQYPNLELTLSEGKTEELLELITHQRIDAALVALPVSVSGIYEQLLFTERFKVALPKNHSLASAGILEASDLKNENLLLMESGHCLRSQTLQSCGNSNPQSQTVKGTSLEMILQMIEIGAGYTLLPEMIADSKFIFERVSIVTFNEALAFRNIGLISTIHSNRSADCVLMADFFKMHHKSKTTQDSLAAA